MSRPRSATFGFLIALVLALIACSGGGEQQILQKYFSASKLRDQGTLGNIATISFDPNRDGSVQSFSVTNVTEERKRPLRIRELAKVHDAARAEDEAFTKRKKEYQDTNLEAIDRVLKAERSNGRLKGKDAEIQAAWVKWREETGDHAKKVQRARSELNAERFVAEISLFDARNPLDLSKFDGELSVKEVSIAAKVQTPAGQTADKNLTVTMQRATGKTEDGKERQGRWIITDIKEAGAAGTKSS